MAVRPLQILLTEDSPGDMRLTREALVESGVAHELHYASDGVDAMAFLRREGALGGAAPDLILLDLNMPRKDGREVLAEIKGDQLLRSIPVLILTTSEAERDVNTCYDLHCNCYITKPVELEDFFEVFRRLGRLWGQSVRLPPPRYARQGGANA